ncbi:hypothetical protein [Halobacillus sp. K22]|uniref:hypothetical protein n=1 Tax=Halobacillus sp. K22 TaxID=3457431 RepID=UPI003FCC6F5E
MIIAILFLSALFLIMLKVPNRISNKPFEKKYKIHILIAVVTAVCISIIVLLLDTLGVGVKFILVGAGTISIVANLNRTRSIYLHHRKNMNTEY